MLRKRSLLRTRSVRSALRREDTRRPRSWIISFHIEETRNCSGTGATGVPYVSGATTGRQDGKIPIRYITTERWCNFGHHLQIFRLARGRVQIPVRPAPETAGPSRVNFREIAGEGSEGCPRKSNNVHRAAEMPCFGTSCGIFMLKIRD